MKKELLYFYLPGCPYCRQADRVLEKMLNEAEFARIALRRVDETKESALAEQYDYWYVPCIWDGKRKLYEAHPGESAAETEQLLRKVFAECLNEGL